MVVGEDFSDLEGLRIAALDGLKSQTLKVCEIHKRAAARDTAVALWRSHALGGPKKSVLALRFPTIQKKRGGRFRGSFPACLAMPRKRVRCVPQSPMGRAVFFQTR